MDIKYLKALFFDRSTESFVEPQSLSSFAESSMPEKQVAEHVRAYKDWLVSQSSAWKSALRDVPADLKKEARKHDLKLPDDCLGFFSILHGQKTTRLWALPCDKETKGMALLSMEDCSLSHSNSRGLRYLTRNLPYTIQYDVSPGVGADDWCENWIPIAERNNGWGSSILFVDHEPTAGFPAGRVVIQTSYLGNEDGRIVRTVVAESIADYFAQLNGAIADGSILHVEGKGVQFASAVGSSGKALAAAWNHSSIGRSPQPDRATAAPPREGSRSITLNVGGRNLQFEYDERREQTACKDGAWKIWAGFHVADDVDVGAPEESQSNVLFILEPASYETHPALAPPERYARALEWLFANEAAVKDAALKGIMGYIGVLRRELDSEELDAVSSAADLESMIHLRYVHVFPHLKGGIPYLGLNFDCSWDEDHHCAVLLHGHSVVDVGTSDVVDSSSLEDDSGAALVTDFPVPPISQEKRTPRAKPWWGWPLRASRAAIFVSFLVLGALSALLISLLSLPGSLLRKITRR